MLFIIYEIMKKIKKDDYYECLSCKINSTTKDRMCPCPRGNCDARITGTLIITTIKQINTDLTKEQINWNLTR